MSEYQNKIVRDLAWVIRSKPLIADPKYPYVIDAEWCKLEFERHQEMLNHFDSNPEVMGQPVAGKLGNYFEFLFQVWMSHSPYYKLIAQNIQLNFEGETKTEVDFIVQEVDSKKYFHIETAVKFYLQYQDSWIGPSAKDTLARKLKTVNEKQILTFEHPWGKQLLSQLSIDQVQSQFFVKGQLFTHDDWVREDDLHLIENENLFWLIVPKPYWLGQLDLVAGELPVLSWPELKREVERQQLTASSVMIASCSKYEGRFIEERRWFVAGREWNKIKT